MSANGALSLLGWTFLPNLVTGWVQTIYYGIMIRAGDPKPIPGTERYNTHRRRIHIAVVSAYLLYTIYEADWDIRRSSDFYQDLGLPYTASEKEIKSKFRRMAAQYHPDKMTGNDQSNVAENYFMLLKEAQDTLLEPVKRFAYDRFGPSVLNWKHCSSYRDYVYAGVWAIIPYYLAGAAGMYALGLVGYLEWGKFWRWLTLACMCTFELYCVSRPFYPPIVDKVINPLLTTFTNHPPYLPFQAIELARKLSITVYIAFSQIGPLLQASTQPVHAGGPKVSIEDQLLRLEQLTVALDNESSRMMATEMTPFLGDEASLKDVQKKVKDFLVQNTIRNDPEVRDAIGRVVQKRRDAPAGARGNR